MPAAAKRPAKITKRGKVADSKIKVYDLDLVTDIIFNSPVCVFRELFQYLDDEHLVFLGTVESEKISQIALS